MTPPPPPDALCIGAVLWDIIGRTSRAMHHGADVPGRIERVPGGVAMNAAITLRRLGFRPALLTAIGCDAPGQALVAASRQLGIDTRFTYRAADLPTDCYLALEDANGLVAAIADAHSLEAAGDRILEPLEDGRLASLTEPWRGLVVLDGNLTEALLAKIAEPPLFAAADLRIAPASPGKAERLLPLLNHPRATFYLNREEAGLLCGLPFSNASEAAHALVTRGARRVLVTNGARECCDGLAQSGIICRLPPQVCVTRVTGAGDTFMAAHIAAEVRGADRIRSLESALAAAAAHISEGVVHPPSSPNAKAN